MEPLHPCLGTPRQRYTPRRKDRKSVESYLKSKYPDSTFHHLKLADDRENYNVDKHIAHKSDDTKFNIVSHFIKPKVLSECPDKTFPELKKVLPRKKNNSEFKNVESKTPPSTISTSLLKNGYANGKQSSGREAASASLSAVNLQKLLLFDNNGLINDKSLFRNPPVVKINRLKHVLQHALEEHGFISASWVTMEMKLNPSLIPCNILTRSSGVVPFVAKTELQNTPTKSSKIDFASASKKLRTGRLKRFESKESKRDRSCGKYSQKHNRVLAGDKKSRVEQNLSTNKESSASEDLYPKHTVDARCNGSKKSEAELNYFCKDKQFMKCKVVDVSRSSSKVGPFIAPQIRQITQSRKIYSKIRDLNRSKYSLKNSKTKLIVAKSSKKSGNVEEQVETNKIMLAQPLVMQQIRLPRIVIPRLVMHNYTYQIPSRALQLFSEQLIVENDNLNTSFCPIVTVTSAENGTKRRTEPAKRIKHLEGEKVPSIPNRGAVDFHPELPTESLDTYLTKSSGSIEKLDCANEDKHEPFSTESVEKPQLDEESIESSCRFPESSFSPVSCDLKLPTENLHTADLTKSAGSAEKLEVIKENQHISCSTESVEEHQNYEEILDSCESTVGQNDIPNQESRVSRSESPTRDFATVECLQSANSIVKPIDTKKVQQLGPLEFSVLEEESPEFCSESPLIENDIPLQEGYGGFHQIVGLLVSPVDSAKHQNTIELSESAEGIQKLEGKEDQLQPSNHNEVLNECDNLSPIISHPTPSTESVENEYNTLPLETYENEVAIEVIAHQNPGCSEVLGNTIKCSLQSSSIPYETSGNSHECLKKSSSDHHDLTFEENDGVNLSVPTLMCTGNVEDQEELEECSVSKISSCESLDAMEVEIPSNILEDLVEERPLDKQSSAEPLPQLSMGDKIQGAEILPEENLSGSTEGSLAAPPEPLCKARVESVNEKTVDVCSISFEPFTQSSSNELCGLSSKQELGGIKCSLGEQFIPKTGVTSSRRACVETIPLELLNADVSLANPDKIGELIEADDRSSVSELNGCGDILEKTGQIEEHFSCIKNMEFEDQLKILKVDSTEDLNLNRQLDNKCSLENMPSDFFELSDDDTQDIVDYESLSPQELIFDGYFEETDEFFEIEEDPHEEELDTVAETQNEVLDPTHLNDVNLGLGQSSSTIEIRKVGISKRASLVQPSPDVSLTVILDPIEKDERLKKLPMFERKQLVNTTSQICSKLDGLLFDEEFEQNANATPLRRSRVMKRPDSPIPLRSKPSELLFDEEYETSNHYNTPLSKICLDPSITISRVRSKRPSGLCFDEEFEQSINASPFKKQKCGNMERLSSNEEDFITPIGIINKLEIDDNDNQPVSRSSSLGCLSISSDDECGTPLNDFSDLIDSDFVKSIHRPTPCLQDEAETDEPQIGSRSKSKPMATITPRIVDSTEDSLLKQDTILSSLPQENCLTVLSDTNSEPPNRPPRKINKIFPCEEETLDPLIPKQTQICSRNLGGGSKEIHSEQSSVKGAANKFELPDKSAETSPIISKSARNSRHSLKRSKLKSTSTGSTTRCPVDVIELTDSDSESYKVPTLSNSRLHSDVNLSTEVLNQCTKGNNNNDLIRVRTPEPKVLSVEGRKFIKSYSKQLVKLVEKLDEPCRSLSRQLLNSPRKGATSTLRNSRSAKGSAVSVKKSQDIDPSSYKPSTNSTFRVSVKNDGSTNRCTPLLPKSSLNSPQKGTTSTLRNFRSAKGSAVSVKESQGIDPSSYKPSTNSTFSVSVKNDGSPNRCSPLLPKPSLNSILLEKITPLRSERLFYDDQTNCSPGLSVSRSAASEAFPSKPARPKQFEERVKNPRAIKKSAAIADSPVEKLPSSVSGLSITSRVLITNQQTNSRPGCPLQEQTGSKKNSSRNRPTSPKSSKLIPNVAITCPALKPISSSSSLKKNSLPPISDLRDLDDDSDLDPLDYDDDSSPEILPERHLLSRESLNFINAVTRKSKCSRNRVNASMRNSSVVRTIVSLRPPKK